MTRLALSLVLSLMVGGLVYGAEPQPKTDKKDDSYIKIEAKGKLLTGVMAIGGETTGTMIRTSVGSFDLDLDKKMAGESKKLSDKVVIVTGTMYMKPGVTRGPRMIIKVVTLKEAK